MKGSVATQTQTGGRPAPQFIIGLALIACWWPLAWIDVGDISHYYFFPLWLGYIFIADGLVLRKTQTSPLTRLGWRYIAVFVISAPFWWLFELLNESLANWFYITPWGFGVVGRAIIGSLSFSTVIPAVLTTAELIFAYSGITRRGKCFSFGPRKLLLFHVSGWLMLGTMLIWPEYLFPLCWISVLFIIEPLARRAGAYSLSSLLESGNWRAVVSIGLAGLVCGWFWEMWNYFAMPKWIYDVPHVGVLKVWEMPLLGYGGYIPFAFEIFAFYTLATGLLPRVFYPATSQPALQIGRDNGRFI